MLKRAQQRGQCDGQRYVLAQPAQVFQREGHTLQEMRFSLIKAAEPIRPQRLHNAHIDKSVVMAHELFLRQLDELRERRQVALQQMLAQRGRQVGLGVIEQGGNIVVQRAFAPTLIVQKERLAVA